MLPCVRQTKATSSSTNSRRFGDLVRVAADICQTPAAVIAIVDGERRWFKVKLSSEVIQLPRETALCTQTILDTQNVLVVEDASKDPRFTAIGEPEVRFYAGAPLTTSTGQAIGAVCVMDTQPRSISNEQLGDLCFLTQQVILAVEEHRKRRESET